MRAFIILATIALAHGAKLERTYLPPSHARTSGGSGNFLQAPISGPSNTYSQNGNKSSQRGAGFSQTGAEFSQTGAEFSQTGAEFSQTGAEFIQGDFGNNNEFNGVNGFNNFERPERPQAALERSAAILRQDNSNDGETFAYAFETENGIYAEESGVARNGVEAQGGYSYTGDDGQIYSIRYTADQNGFVPQGDHIPTPPPVPEEILKALEQNAQDEAAGIFDDGLYNEAKYSDKSAIQQYQQNYNGNDDDAVVTNAAFIRNYPTDADTPRDTSSTGASFARTPTSGVQKAYLPPFTTRTTGSFRGLSSAISGPNVSSFANRGSFGRTSGIETSYLPPSIAEASAEASLSPRGSNGPAFATRSSNGPTFRSRGSAGPVFGQKAYLPPFATQAGNELRRQQSFDSKNGYRY